MTAKSPIPLDWYQVKWRPIGSKKKWRYGTVDSYHDGANDMWECGMVRINDMIKPFYDDVSISDTEMEHLSLSIGRESRRVDPETGNVCFGEWGWVQEQSRKRAVKKSQSVSPGKLVGKLFSVSVADGYASYVVTKEAAETATVEWRGFNPDSYTDQVLGWGGQFPRHVIERLVKAEDALRALFDKAKKRKQS
jgi:hypothetical protein